MSAMTAVSPRFTNTNLVRPSALPSSAPITVAGAVPELVSVTHKATFGRLIKEIECAPRTATRRTDTANPK